MPGVPNNASKASLSRGVDGRWIFAEDPIAASAFAAQHPHGALDDPRVPVTGRYGILADQERGRDSELDPRSTAGRAEVEMGAMLLTQQI